MDACSLAQPDRFFFFARLGCMHSAGKNILLEKHQIVSHAWCIPRLHVTWGSIKSQLGLDFFYVQVIYVIVKIVTPCLTGLAFLASRSLVGQCTGNKAPQNLEIELWTEFMQLTHNALLLSAISETFQHPSRKFSMHLLCSPESHKSCNIMQLMIEKTHITIIHCTVYSLHLWIDESIVFVPHVCLVDREKLHENELFNFSKNLLLLKSYYFYDYILTSQ